MVQKLTNLPAVQETWVWSLGREDPLQNGMVAHSSILGWRILWAEKPGMLPSRWLQRAKHDWVITLSLSEWKTVENKAGALFTEDELLCTPPGLLCFMWRHNLPRAQEASYAQKHEGTAAVTQQPKVRPSQDLFCPLHLDSVFKIPARKSTKILQIEMGYSL